VHEIEQPGALRAERAPVHRMVRVSLDVDDACLGILGGSRRVHTSRMPQATAQYGQVLRVSVARAELKLTHFRECDAAGEKPISARLEPAKEAPVTARNRRRVMSAMETPSACLHTL
jgi:hypothetical protein